MSTDRENNSACLRCGKKFFCGAKTGNCWCMELPKIMPLTVKGKAVESCYCLECLKDIIEPEVSGKS